MPDPDAPKPRIEPIYRRLGEEIAWYRSQRGITQETLGRKLGVTRAHINNMESGTARIMCHHLPKLAKALDIEISFLGRGPWFTVVA